MKHVVNDFQTIEIMYDTSVESYRVKILTPLYMRKERLLSHTYSKDWLVEDIINDIYLHYLK